jgi:hypothetical protein
VVLLSKSVAPAAEQQLGDEQRVCWLPYPPGHHHLQSQIRMRPRRRRLNGKNRGFHILELRVVDARKIKNCPNQITDEEERAAPFKQPVFPGKHSNGTGHRPSAASPYI